MKKFKRMLAVLTAVLMLLCMLPSGVFAEGEDIPINETNFPDANFREIVLNGYYDWDNEEQVLFDTDSSGALSPEEIAAVTKINVSSKNISNLKGIEYFTELTRLDCYGNRLTSLDVSNNTALEYLECNENRLTSLDVSKLTALKQLYCDWNQLTELDVSKLTALSELRCIYNQLTELDVSKNTALTELWCDNNQLTELDVSGATALKHLVCYLNQLTELDVSNNTALEELECNDNYKLTTLNVSGAAALTKLYCHRNQLTELDVSGATALKHLVCYDNQLTELDVSNNTQLTSLNCGYNQLTKLNVNGAAALTLTSLWCDSNRLTELDVSNNTALKWLKCNINQLTELNVSNNTALTYLGCGDNQLTELNVSNNTKLTTLYCHYNQLTELDVSNNTELVTLECYCNQLAELNVSGAAALKHLVCYVNQLTELDVSNNTQLTELWCSDNQLTELDVSNNTALTYLGCGDNQLTNLDLSHNTQLHEWNPRTDEGFSCESNQYTVYTNPFDLTTLPGNFDVTKASNWHGGTVDGNMLTFNANEVTYTYDCENNLTAEFKLILSDGITPVPAAPEGMGTITVVNPKVNTRYNAYRVFDLTYSPADAPVNYAYTIENDSAWFAVIQTYASDTAHGLKLTPTTADPNHYIVEFASADNPIEGYQNFSPVDFATYLKTNVPENAQIAAWRESGSNPTGPIKLTTNGNAPDDSFTNVYVPLGYYFVTTSIGTFCSLDSADPDAYIYDKNEVPGWDTLPGSTDLLGKVVAAEDPYATENPGTWGKTTVETIGSEAWFKIMAHVPAYEYGHQVKQYTFTDTLGDGFTYDEGSLKITLYTGLDTNDVPIANPSMVLYDSTNTTVQGVTVTLPGESNTITIRLQLTGDGAIANYYPDAHKDAVYDNVNTAEMEWTWDDSNPVPNPPSAPEPEQPAVPDDVHTDTYVYGFPFNKTIKGSETVTYLPGAEFELYKNEACTEKINLVVDNELPEGAPAQEPEDSVQWTYYRVADATETAPSVKIEAGRAVIWGLEPGTYYLLETKAPDGYNLLTTVFPVTICTEDDPNTQDVNEDNVDEHGYVNVETFNVENASGAELPSTGGIGTTIFYIVGALLMTAAVVLPVVKKRMSVQE